MEEPSENFSLSKLSEKYEDRENNKFEYKLEKINSE